MPIPRTLLAIPVSLALLCLSPPASRAGAASTPNTLVPLLVTRGEAPGAALLALDGTGSGSAPGGTEYAQAGADHAPAGTGRASSGADRAQAGTDYAQAGTGISRADHFRAGSITKTFIATVVLQLAAEHRLSLSDTVEQHLPGLVRGAGNDGRALTLRSLLTHTSGLYDFTAVTGGTIPVSPLAAVRIALTHPPADRGRFSYSNTNYVLLGLVIRQVTGRSYATEAERRIIAPLRLTGTSFPGSRTTLPSPHGRAYAADGSDVTDLDPRVAGAAGELVTTLADLDRFYSALLGGGLLPSRWLREMLNTRTAHGSYGMGLFPVRLPCGTTVWGHNGRISGSYVRTAATVDGRHVLTFRVNTSEIADPGLEPALLAAEFCPRTS
ncbi:serine hydrolase domain-containing protein [Streptomyces sp. W16]|uniref:serine hydrolase domain-containing protein n=1 Tax=Streptomyces sp. W16 TaxID=3076631 RepID=UPI00295AD602|nr:serine hydrolase domain-containing protein [Streptomyces sp. W16]MDV9176422.1 serine hydrolase domain-containing protein [Streptomyces sp. W16]